MDPIQNPVGTGPQWNGHEWVAVAAPHQARPPRPLGLFLVVAVLLAVVAVWVRPGADSGWARSVVGPATVPTDTSVTLGAETTVAQQTDSIVPPLPPTPTATETSAAVSPTTPTTAPTAHTTPDAEAALALGKEKRSLENTVVQLESLSESLADTRDLFTMAVDEADDDTLVALEADALKIESGVEALEFRRMFSNPADPSPCFVEIQAGAEGDGLAAQRQDDAGVSGVEAQQDGGHGEKIGTRGAAENWCAAHCPLLGKTLGCFPPVSGTVDNRSGYAGSTMSNQQWPPPGEGRDNSPWSHQDPGYRPTQFHDVQGRDPRQPFGQPPAPPPDPDTVRPPRTPGPVSYTHLRAHETPEHLVCRLLLEKKK